MSNVLLTYVARPRPGKTQSFLQECARATRIIERNGARVRFWSNACGTDLGTYTIAIETVDFREFGEYRSKIASDPDWLTFFAETQGSAEPTADFISSALYVEEMIA